MQNFGEIDKEYYGIFCCGPLEETNEWIKNIDKSLLNGAIFGSKRSL